VDVITLLIAVLMMFIWVQLYMARGKTYHAFIHIGSSENNQAWVDADKRFVFWTVICFFYLGGMLLIFMHRLSNLS